MGGILRVDPADALPIWRQIEEGVRRLVASRALGPGVAVPSVRDMARDLRINPATVAKAYQRLVDTGVLVMKRGEGTFVAEHPRDLGDQALEAQLKEGATRFAALALTAGADLAQAEKALKSVWKELKGGSR